MRHLPDFEAWAIFAKVAESNSFSKAALALGLSKGTVSKAISRLEERMGTSLLHRTSRHLSLTESGRVALTRATHLLEEGEAIEAEVSEDANNPYGVVRIASPISFGIQALGPILPEFLAEYPGVSIDLHLSDSRVDVVAEGFDIALRMGDLPDSSLRARRLFSIRRPVVASRAYLDHYGRPTHPRELSQHEVIIYSHIEHPHIWRFSHPDEGRVEVKVDGRIHVDNGDVAMGPLLSGIGIACQPEFFIWQALRDGVLEELFPEWTIPPYGMFLLTPPGRARPARVRALLGFLAQRFQKAPWVVGKMERHWWNELHPPFE